MRDSGGRVLGVVLPLLLAASAWGEESVAASAPAPVVDLFQARVRYGVAVRSGSQKDTGPSLSYSGLTPNDLAVQGWGWFLLDRHLGAFLSLQREGFALYTSGSRVTGGGLFRAAVGPTGRLAFGPVKLELGAGYAFHQLPAFGNSSAPVFEAATRHGVLLAARGIVDVGPVAIEARGEVPLALSVSSGLGGTGAGSASATGFSAGGGLRVQLLRFDTLMVGVLADVNYVTDTLTNSVGSSTQSVIRVGGALDVKWQEEVVVPRFGDVEVQVVDADSGAALPGAAVEIGERKFVADPLGVAKLTELIPGAVAAKASLGGYVPGEERGEITAGSALKLLLKLKKEAPKTGGLVIKVTNKEAKTPLAKAAVKLGGATVVTDEQGVAKFADLQPGPIQIVVTLAGYNNGEEVGSVVAGQESEVSVAMVEVKKRIPATITGLVRSTDGGKPIAAELELPQLKIKTKASAAGAFTFQLEGGTYTMNISAPGYLSQSKSVTIKDGDQAIFNVDLHPR